jgi:hypothetical protein
MCPLRFRPSRMTASAAICLLTMGVPVGPVAGADDTAQADAAAGSAPAAALGTDCDISKAAFIGTAGFGLACLDDSGWHALVGEDSGLQSDTIIDVAIGPDGRVWVVQPEGLSVTDGTSWETFERDTWGGAPQAVSFGADGSVWVAYFGGVGRFDGSEWTTWPATELATGEYPDLLSSIAVAPDGMVWVAGSASIASFDGTRWTIYESGNGLPGESAAFADIAAGPGGVWVANSDGVLGWNGAAWLTNSGFALAWAQALAIDPDGRVWAGTWRAGVSVFDRTGWLSYDRAGTGLSSDDVASMAVDGQGRVWAGTSYGLDVLEDGVWQSYHMHDSGLLDDDVTAVAVSGPGPALPATAEESPGSLSGVALEGAAPLAGVTVELCTEDVSWAPEGSTPCAAQPFSLQATTGPDGRFLFEEVPVGRYDIAIPAASGDWESAVRTLGISSPRFLVQEDAETDVGSIDIAPPA